MKEAPSIKAPYAYGKISDASRNTALNMLEMTAEQKRRGELNEAQMEETYRALAPFLSSQQKAQLRSLLDSLK